MRSSRSSAISTRPPCARSSPSSSASGRARRRSRACPNPYRPPAPTVLTRRQPTRRTHAVRPPAAQDQRRSDDLPALIVVDRILGASPESRIPDRVREKEGLSYGIQTGSCRRASRRTRCSTCTRSSRPQNRERVGAAIAEELARALKDGFTEAEVADAKRALLQARRIARAQDRARRRRSCSRPTSAARGTMRRRSTRASPRRPLERVNAVLRKYVDAPRLRLVVRRRFREGEVDFAGGRAVKAAPRRLGSNGQNDAKTRLAAHHAVVGFGDALQREGLVHRPHAGARH